MSSAPITLVWLRNTLRVSDHPGLYQSAQQGPVGVVYIDDDIIAPEGFKKGAATRWGLHQALDCLNTALEGKLNIYQGTPSDILLKWVERYAVKKVVWDCCYSPWARKDEQKLKTGLRKLNISYEVHNSAYLYDPWYVLKNDNSPYKVFTPFRRKAWEVPPRNPFPAPSRLELVQDSHNTVSLSTLKLLPKLSWHKKLYVHWTFGEQAAQEQLQNFIQKGLNGYKTHRDYPAGDYTSRLSAHLHFGSLSPYQVWEAVSKAPNIPAVDREHFLSELTWREFSAHLLYHFPDLPSKNFHPSFNAFPWGWHKDRIEAWQSGQTGYPIVDAGMRELWHTGSMHNRVRMIVASFLTKNLNVHWHVGRDWFWDCLVDADLANNSASWQWVAGCGADAAPYFRIFNPVTQAEKFDPQGRYVKKWLPELAQLPFKWLFQPWEAPIQVLRQASIELGSNYPHPLVDLKQSRQQALDAYHICRTQ